MTRHEDCHVWRFIVYALVVALALYSFAALGKTKLDQSKPNMVVADENRVPIPGISGSTSHETAIEKVVNNGPGKYIVIRPDWHITITDHAVPCDCDPVDTDGDGVFDADDQCPNTPPNDGAGSATVVDAVGCAVIVAPVDTDSDGVPDVDDQCPGTVLGDSVVSNGCSPAQIDNDGDGVFDDVDQCPNSSPTAVVDAVGCAVIVAPPATALIECPDEPTATSATRTWTVCAVNSIDVPGYTSNGSDYKMSYRVPTALSPTNKGQIYIYMHPSTPGTEYVTGSSSFDYSSKDANKQIEIHFLEQTVGKNPEGVENSGGWWGWSGHNRGAVGNYNGKQLVAGVKYLVENHGGLIDISKGIKLGGVSLGGAGAYIQAQLMKPLLAELKTETGIDIQIASAISFWGIQNPKEADEAKFSGGWGTKVESPDEWAATDICANWRDVQNLHFYWAGGQNDGLGRMSDCIVDIFQERKISHSMRWLQSGHGPNESGYTLPYGTWKGNSNSSLDVILPVFTNNTADHRGVLRGYINRGLAWDHDAIIDTVDEIQVPVKYEALKNIGPELPDQPDVMETSITFRHVTNFDTRVGREVDWEFDGQTGTTTVGGDGLLTVDKVKITTGDAYKVFSVKKHDGGVVIEPPTAVRPFDFVATRVPRSTGVREAIYGGELLSSSHWDWMDKLPDVTRKFHSFNAPGQLLRYNMDGSEEILYDCMGAVRPCVPLDPMISPDGKWVAYAVFSANALVHTHPANRKFPVMVLGSSGKRSHIVMTNLETGETVEWPELEGVNDSSPVFLPDGKIMFTSNQGGFVVPYLDRITHSSAKQPRLFTANWDGTNRKDVSPHEVTAAMHPYVHSTGLVFYSTHWLSHNLGYKGNNSIPNWPGTTGNQWSVGVIDHEGGNFASALGGHRQGITQAAGQRNHGLIVPHFLGERSNGDMCTDNYYRGGNLGIGNIACWVYIFPIEGPAPRFTPDGMYTLTTWAWPQDATSIKDSNGIYQGKTGYPEGIPGSDQMLLTHGSGMCTQVVEKPFSKLEGSNNIGCNTGIKMTRFIPSRHPDDLITLVDEEDWHEFGARIITSKTYQKVATSENADGSCTLASSDAGATDSYHSGTYNFNSEFKHSGNNGSLMEAVPHTELKSIRFYKLKPNPKVSSRDWKNFIGHEIELYGDVPLLADNSFKVDLPCDVPYIMAGVDKDGLIIKRDQVPASLRPGEARVCEGCHLHSVRGRPYPDSLAFGSVPLKFTESMPVPTFTDDVLPIFQEECSGCHTPDDSPFFDYKKLVSDYSQKYAIHRQQMTNDTRDIYKYAVQRPMATKYVSTTYCRESLLCWVVYGYRMDNRTNELYDDDIDLPPGDHPTLPRLKANVVGRWIDSGSAK